MTKINIFPALLLMLWLSGCSHIPGSTGFTYRYSMESAGNYKVELQLNPDSTFVIGWHNYFFDRFERKRQPLYHKGKLTGEEYRAFQKLIDKSRLERMQDSYGFDNPDTDRSVIYMLELEKEKQTKYVSVNGIASKRFHRNFIRLIQHSAQFIDDRNPE